LAHGYPEQALASVQTVRLPARTLVPPAELAPVQHPGPQLLPLLLRWQRPALLP
jgi:hypothetical protein